MNANTYTFKTNPAKYANLHKCDQKYWKFTCDFSQTQSKETLLKAIDDTRTLLGSICQCDVFKPENREAATQLSIDFDDARMHLGKDDIYGPVDQFLVYQYQRYAFRIWYRDTKAARDAAAPKKETQPKAEKKAPAKKAAQPKAEKKPTTKAPAKQDIAKANEATFVSKLTKAQKKELVLTLLAELIK